ncbi:hypothetical protein SAOR_00830 [Salinisphaera orenii MK-B5]|uniref:Prohead serine protease domain-containing protein n=1 Tax=Salinisphaera orenii MK-B5 TaxID=856730 RepID=A0A423PXS0_9GAMM|nr:HK97 family phage prohead protease [Salinisphaera orenii]ROO30417.1 hypothetical protein SAOR_00830 [Salinisphaera orenii MK-B5]
MLFAPINGGLELRAEADGSHTIAGRFPYGTLAELGRGRRETFAPGAFTLQDDVHLLAGHDYNRPLASRRSGSLTLTDADDGLAFEARISADVADTSHGRDTLALVRAGLSVGLSPGFRVRPNGERVERRSGGLLRTVHGADLFELSVVTRPAYDSAQVEARSWQPENPAGSRSVPAAWRWR